MAGITKEDFSEKIYEITQGNPGLNDLYIRYFLDQDCLHLLQDEKVVMGLRTYSSIKLAVVARTGDRFDSTDIFSEEVTNVIRLSQKETLEILSRLNRSLERR